MLTCTCKFIVVLFDALKCYRFFVYGLHVRLHYIDDLWPEKHIDMYMYCIDIHTCTHVCIEDGWTAQKQYRFNVGTVIFWLVKFCDKCDVIWHVYTYVHVYCACIHVTLTYTCTYMYFPSGWCTSCSFYPGSGIQGQPQQWGCVVGCCQAREWEQRVSASTSAARKGLGISWYCSCDDEDNQVGVGTGQHTQGSVLVPYLMV